MIIISKSRKRRRRGALPSLLLLLLLLLLLHESSHAQQIECNEDSSCEALVWRGSECRNGICSNPFEQGCLYTLLNDPSYGLLTELDTDGDGGYQNEKWQGLLRHLKAHKRICNSDDDPLNSTNCEPSREGTEYRASLKYTEVRIHSQNWESSFFNAWILQILLSEVLSVPSTIETGLPDVHNSFYDPSNALGYGRQNHWQTLMNADQAGDCLTLSKEAPKNSKTHKMYQSCAHVIPEYWDDGSSRNHQNDTHSIKAMEEIGIIERPQALGAIGNQGLYVTKFTAEKDTTILSYLGLQGEQNRQKLAELFLRPTTWGEYCDQVSNFSCFLPDDTAHRPPHNDSEKGRFHVPGLYTGHFRATEKNNCETNPNCTGHVGDFPCDWGSMLQPWIHHLNLPLSSDGHEGKNSYTSEQVTELWDAANATGSNLMTLWYTPEAIHSKYIGTPTEMTRISFPPATQECMDHRYNLQSENLCFVEDVPVGDPKGACDYFPFSFHVIKSRSLRETSHPEGVSPALHSPAYEAVSGYRMSHLQLDEILRHWFGLSSSGYMQDGWDPRFATCTWLYENLEDVLEDVVPPSYPRVLVQENIYELPLYRAALFIGSFTTALALVSGIFVLRRRKTTVMKHAQVDFLLVLLLGLLLVALSSITTALKPTNASCLASVWLIELGYTLELVPLIIKVTAINRLLSAAKKMRRVQISRKLLFIYVCGWFLFTVVGMTVWTLVDPPRPVETFFLTEELNDHGETVVMVETHCSSDEKYWLLGAMTFHFLLLMWAAVLAFQTRNIPQKFNESKVLVGVIYAQCLVLAVRLALLVLPTDAINPMVDTGLTSICLAMDALLTLLIYFVPKLTLYRQTESRRMSHMHANTKVYGWDNNTQTNRFSMDCDSSDGQSSNSHANSHANSHGRRVTLSREGKGLSQSRQQAQEEIHVATTLVDELQTENSSLKEENQALQESNDILLQRVEHLEEEVVNLRQQFPPDEEETTLSAVFLNTAAGLDKPLASPQEQVPLEQVPPDEGETEYFDEKPVASPQEDAPLEQVPPDEDESDFFDAEDTTNFFDVCSTSDAFDIGSDPFR